MQKRTAEIIAFCCIIILVVAVVWNQSRESSLQTQVLYGYPTADTTVPDTPDEPDTLLVQQQQSGLVDHPPLSRDTIGDIAQLHYVVDFRELVVVDGLQVSDEVASLRTPINWVDQSAEDVTYTLDDPESVRTFFRAPEKTGTIVLDLMVRQDRVYEQIARYRFKVRSPLARQIDANNNKIADFPDLLHLLQNWNSYEPRAVQMLAIFLSEYEGNAQGSQE